MDFGLAKGNSRPSSGNAGKSAEDILLDDVANILGDEVAVMKTGLGPIHLIKTEGRHRRFSFAFQRL